MCCRGLNGLSKWIPGNLNYFSRYWQSQNSNNLLFWDGEKQIYNNFRSKENRNQLENDIPPYTRQKPSLWNCIQCNVIVWHSKYETLITGFVSWLMMTTLPNHTYWVTGENTHHNITTTKNYISLRSFFLLRSLDWVPLNYLWIVR